VLLFGYSCLGRRILIEVLALVKSFTDRISYGLNYEAYRLAGGIWYVAVANQGCRILIVVYSIFTK